MPPTALAGPKRRTVGTSRLARAGTAVTTEHYNLMIFSCHIWKYDDFSKKLSKYFGNPLIWWIFLGKQHGHIHNTSTLKTETFKWPPVQRLRSSGSALIALQNMQHPTCVSCFCVCVRTSGVSSNSTKPASWCRWNDNRIQSADLIGSGQLGSSRRFMRNKILVFLFANTTQISGDLLSLIIQKEAS